MWRKNVFNKKSMPFLLLSIIHFFLFFLLIKKNRSKTTWILLFSNTGFAYLFEYIVLNYLHAYKYKPSLVKKGYFDNVFGAIFSQGIFLPITSTFLTIFQKSWFWKLGFSFYFYLIEKLFLLLKVYKENWWKPIYTFVLINVYFFVSDRFYEFFQKNKNWAFKIAYFLSIEITNATLLYFSAIKRRVRFGFGRHHSRREHFDITPIYTVSLSIFTLLTSFNSSIRYRLLSIMSKITFDFILIKIKLLKITKNSFPRRISFHILMEVLSQILYYFFPIRKKDNSNAE